MNNRIIIGVDHGYSAMKTSHFAFPAGLVAHEYEPYTQMNVLEYDGRFYVILPTPVGLRPPSVGKIHANAWLERSRCSFRLWS